MAAPQCALTTAEYDWSVYKERIVKSPAEVEPFTTLMIEVQGDAAQKVVDVTDVLDRESEKVVADQGRRI